MRIVWRYLGYLFIISAFFRIIPIVVGLAYGENILEFGVNMGISMVVGGVLAYFFRANGEEDRMNLGGGFILATLSFLLIPVVGAISFLKSFDYNFLNAYFESVSGFSTTGFTLYESLDVLPKSLLIWRALSQWLGGIGIVVFFLFIISTLFLGGSLNATKAETVAKTSIALYKSQGFEQNFPGGLGTIVRAVLGVYCGYTFLGFLLLMFFGMGALEALGMSFTSISTGGFTMSDVFFTNSAQLAVLSILMIMGSISFFVHFKLLRGLILEFLRSFEKNVFFVFLFMAVCLGYLVYRDLGVVIFQIVSSFTTTGYTLIDNISLLPQLFLLMIFVGMLVGGGVAGTSGGLKVSRVYYLMRSVPWHLRKLILPSSAVVPFKVHGKILEDYELNNISIFAAMYVMLIFVGVVIFMVFGYSFLDSAFQVVSALGTVGLQNIDLNGLNAALKLLLILLMIFGRLEIFPFLILLKSIWKARSQSV
ncbi:hypothetical protein KJ632_00570 [Patescibacteria group bacterium]|nr:hypothetical protein [Patescibacteria group bacterium]